MSTFKKKKEFIDNFFLFLIDLNLNRTAKDVLSELYEKGENPIIKRNLKFIKKKNIEAKAQIKKTKFQQAQKLLSSLKKEKGDELFETIKNALGKKKQIQFDALYRKFKDFNDEDIKSMLEDEKLIEIMRQIDQKSELTDEDKEN